VYITSIVGIFHFARLLYQPDSEVSLPAGASEVSFKSHSAEFYPAPWLPVAWLRQLGYCVLRLA
jgi:hypothetical protein